MAALPSSPWFMLHWLYKVKAVICYQCTVRCRYMEFVVGVHFLFLINLTVDCVLYKNGLVSVLCHSSAIDFKIESGDRPLIYNFTSPEDLGCYRRWWPTCTKSFICLFLSSCLSLSHSAHSNPRWREAPCETAWRWQRTWEPFKASSSESDKGLCVWQLGTPLEPCTALRCTVLAVDHVLKPPPNPAPLETTHRNRHPYHTHITHSILIPVMYIDGWWCQKNKKKMKNKTRCGKGRWLWTWGTNAGTCCPAASPMWVLVHANPLHAHLQRLVLLLLLGCSGAGRLCVQTPIKPHPLWLRTGVHHSDST